MDKNLKTALIVVAVVLAAVVTLASVAGAFLGLRNSGFGMMGGLGAMGLMSIVWVVVIGLIVWAVIAAARGSGSQGGSGQPESALDILNKRYARGEINKAEYEDKKKDLS